MDTVENIALYIAVAVVLLAIVVGVFVNQSGRAGQTKQGHDRCAFCRSRLNADGPSYATTCHMCGRMQPWAAPGFQ